MKHDPRLNAATRKINVPEKMRHLPISDRGYIVPWFVAWVKDDREVGPGVGQPDFRAIGGGKIQKALREKRCWLCGGRLGVYQCFAIGPMCAVNRVTAEPPSHKACARYAVQACPFLTQPKMVRNEKDLPTEASPPPGEMIRRNPGVTLLWTTLSYHIEGGLFRLGDPTDVEWWSHGRHATRAEVIESVQSGLPILAATCQGDAECLAALRDACLEASIYFPREAEAAE